MNKVQLILFFVLALAMGCDNSDNDQPRATSFTGKVVYADDGLPFEGEIKIFGRKYKFPVDLSIVSKTQQLPSDGSFSLNFVADGKIDYFAIGFFEPLEVDDTRTFTEASCGNFDCGKIDPGFDYDNLTITLER